MNQHLDAGCTTAIALIGKAKQHGEGSIIMAAKTKKTADNYPKAFCGMPEDPVRTFDDHVHPGRAAAILDDHRKWVSGTTLHYYFFDEHELSWDRSRFRWGGNAAQKRAIGDAFDQWAALKIGLDFVEVTSPAEAEIRIGFVWGDGSWSWLGRRILEEPLSARTMNFGWDISNDVDTAIHEIGHTMAMPHEHQNPFSGIVWDEEAVYDDLGGPPNNWSRRKTDYNILRKLPEDGVSGSEWDPNSIMHYSFRQGLILTPERYHDEPLIPAPGLSPADKRMIKEWYPKVGARMPKLEPFKSERISLEPGEQVQYLIEPDSSRDYQIRTFGEADTVLVLFEEIDGEWRYLDGDDDSGYDRNALIEHKLFKGRRYSVKLRLYWAGETGDFALVLF